jgi:hypothetical protein
MIFGPAGGPEYLAAQQNRPPFCGIAGPLSALKG